MSTPINACVATKVSTPATNLTAVLLADSFLERNSWFPGVVVAVLLFIIGTASTLYLRQRDKDAKHMDYRIIEDTPIFSGPERPELLQVTYFGEDVTDPRKTRVRFKNTGKQTIAESDCIEPYLIRRGSAKLLDHNVIENDKLVTLLGGEVNTLSLKPKTLNSGKWFTVQLFYDGGAQDELTVTGSINSETRPTAIYPSKREREEANRPLKIVAPLGAVMIVLALIILIPSYSPTVDNRAWASMGAVLMFVGIIATIVAAFITFLARRRLKARLRPQPIEDD
jgi:hypothetical protein